MPPPDTSLFVDFVNTHSALKRADPAAAEHFGFSPASWLPPLLEACGAGTTVPGASLCYVAGDTAPEHAAAFEALGFTVRKAHHASVHVQLAVDALASDLEDTVVVIGWPATYAPLLEEIAADGGDEPVIASFPLSPTPPDASREANNTFRTVSALAPFEASLGRPVKRVKPVVPPPAAQRPTALLTKMGGEIEREARASGAVPAGSLPGIYKRFPEFATDSNWLGFRGLLPLTRAVIETCGGALKIRGEGNDWKVYHQPTPKPAPGPTGDDAASLAAGVRDWIAHHLAEQPAPIPAASAASAIAAHFGEHLVDSGWLGHRSFRAFIQAADDPRAAFSAVGPGYLYAPEKHEDPALTDGQDPFAQADPELAGFAKKLSEDHDVPYLSPDAFAIAYRSISDELRDNPFSLGATSRGARDRCPALGKAIPRSSINAILKAILTTPHRFGKGDDSPKTLAAAHAKAISSEAKDIPGDALDRLLCSAL